MNNITAYLINTVLLTNSAVGEYGEGLGHIGCALANLERAAGVVFGDEEMRGAVEGTSYIIDVNGVLVGTASDNSHGRAIGLFNHVVTAEDSKIARSVVLMLEFYFGCEKTSTILDGGYSIPELIKMCEELE